MGKKKWKKKKKKRKNKVTLRNTDSRRPPFLPPLL
jgi:hypothetical protein